MLGLTLLFGGFVGLSLGLTGGGGSILAVPMLVYGLGVDPREAVGLSLAAVGSTALVGAMHRLWRGQIELRTGLLFALAGMLGAPIGTAVGRKLPEPLLLLLFAGLMLWVAARMWRAPGRPDQTDPSETSCRPKVAGVTALTYRCTLVLSAIGLMAGCLSGLFGVGGGFVIVPSLVLATGMDIHQAVATSLLVIALISGSGLVSFLLSGAAISASVTALFVVGGVAGMALGTLLATKLPPARLQQGFAVLIVAVALFVIVKNVH